MCLIVISTGRAVCDTTAMLGIARFFEHILGSADFGVAKPDPRIFHEASARLGIAPGRMLDVGDSHHADYLGGGAAGLQVLLIDGKATADSSGRSIQSLSDVVSLMDSRYGR